MDASNLFNNSSGQVNSSYEEMQVFCRNAYMDRLILNDTQCAIFTAMMVLEMLITLPLNALMIRGIYKTKGLSTTWQYILFLGYAGCSLSLIVIPLNIVLFTTFRSSRSCTLEYAAIFVGQITCQFTVYLIFLLALHRYWMTVSGQKLPGSFLATHCTSKGSIILISIMSIFHGGASVNFFGTIKTSLPNILMKVVDATIGIVISIIYLRLYLNIHRYVKTCRVRFKDDTAVETKVQTLPKRKLPGNIKNLAVTISIILLVIACCYVPFIIMDSWTSWYTFYKSAKAPQTIRFTYYLTYGSVFFTSIANACIVICRDRDLKFYIKSFIYMECFNTDVHPISSEN